MQYYGTCSEDEYEQLRTQFSEGGITCYGPTGNTSASPACISKQGQTELSSQLGDSVSFCMTQRIDLADMLQFLQKLDLPSVSEYIEYCMAYANKVQIRSVYFDYDPPTLDEGATNYDMLRVVVDVENPASGYTISYSMDDGQTWSESQPMFAYGQVEEGDESVQYNVKYKVEAKGFSSAEGEIVVTVPDDLVVQPGDETGGDEAEGGDET